MTSTFTPRRMLFALLSILALGATAASAQAATEGPFYQVAGSRLLAGKSKELTASGRVEFHDLTYRVRIECKALKLKAGASIVGSTGATSGTGKEVIEFSGCIGGATNEGLVGCEPEGGRITTTALVSTLGYSSSARTGPLYVLFKPEAGLYFSTGITFVSGGGGENCVWKTARFEGSAIGELYAGGKPIEVGKNEVEAAAIKVQFRSGAKTIWTETEKALTSTKMSLKAFGTTTELEGEPAFELVGKENWGVFA